MCIVLTISMIAPAQSLSSLLSRKCDSRRVISNTKLSEPDHIMSVKNSALTRTVMIDCDRGAQRRLLQQKTGEIESNLDMQELIRRSRRCYRRDNSEFRKLFCETTKTNLLIDLQSINMLLEKLGILLSSVSFIDGISAGVNRTSKFLTLKQRTA